MLNLLKQLRIMLSPEKKWKAVLLIVFMVVIALMEVAVVAMLMPVVSVFAAPETLNNNRILFFLNQLFHTESATNFIVVCALLTIALSLLKNFLSWVLVHMQSSFCISIADDLASRLYRKYSTLPGVTFANSDNSVFISRLSQIYEVTQELIFPILIAASECCVFFFFTCAIFILNPIVTMALLVTGIITFFLFYRPVRQNMETAGRQYRETAEKMQTSLTETFALNEMIRVTGSYDFFETKFNEIRKSRLNSQRNAANIGQLPRHAMEVFGVLIIMGTVLFVLFTSDSLAGSVAIASFFLATFIRLMPGVSRIQYNLLHMKFGKAMFSQLYEDLQNLPPDLPLAHHSPYSVAAGDLSRHSPFGATPEAPVLHTKWSGTIEGCFAPPFGHIVLDGISFSYPDGTQVFQNFNAVFKQGRTTAVTGKTGRGKTTLVHLLTAYYTPSAGSIKVGNVPIQQDLQAWFSRLGYVPQNIYLINDTIESNVAFGCSKADIDEKRVEECLRFAQFLDFVNSLPQREQTVIGQNGAKLSGGQRQRLAIARALYNNPDIIIFDEPTAALDADTENAIAQSLQNLKGKATIIVITHSDNLINYCDDIVNLS